MNFYIFSLISICAVYTPLIKTSASESDLVRAHAQKWVRAIGVGQLYQTCIAQEKSQPIDVSIPEESGTTSHLRGNVFPNRINLTCTNCHPGAHTNNSFQELDLLLIDRIESGYEFFPQKFRISGALHVYLQQSTSEPQNFQDHTMYLAEEVAKSLAQHLNMKAAVCALWRSVNLSENERAHLSYEMGYSLYTILQSKNQQLLALKPIHLPDPVKESV